MQRAISVRVLQAGAVAALCAAMAAVALRSETVTQQLSPLRAIAAFAALCAAYLALRVDIAWTFSIGIALSVFSGNSSQLGLPVGPDRLVFAFGFAVLAWRARPWAPDRPQTVRATSADLVWWLMVIAMAYAILSAAWADTLTEHAGLYGLLDRFGLVPFLVFLAAPWIYASERQRMVLLTTLVALGGYLGFTALAETLHINALVFPHYILDPTVGIHSDRARGPFVEAVANGLALFFCATAAAIAVVRWRDRLARAAAFAVMVLCALGVIFTLTRAVWVAAAIAPLVALLCSRRTRRWVIPTAVTGGLVVVVALAAVPGLTSEADNRANSKRPVWDRLNTDAAAVRMIEDKPILGFGWSTFVTRGPDYMRQASTYPLTGAGLNVHNVFLSHAVELGIVGLVLWLAAFLAGIGGAAMRNVLPAIEPWRIGLIAIAVCWVIVANFGPLGYAFPTLLLWAWAGLVRAS